MTGLLRCAAGCGGQDDRDGVAMHPAARDRRQRACCCVRYGLLLRWIGPCFAPCSCRPIANGD